MLFIANGLRRSASWTIGICALTVIVATAAPAAEPRNSTTKLLTPQEAQPDAESPPLNPDASAPADEAAGTPLADGATSEADPTTASDEHAPTDNVAEATQESAGSDDPAAAGEPGAAPDDPSAAAVPTEPSDSAEAEQTVATEQGIAVEPAKFKGLQPGSSTRAEVSEVLGEPIDQVDENGLEVCGYQVEPFRRVAIWFDGDRATSIVVDLAQAFDSDKLAEQLGLQAIVPVSVFDAEGRLLGRAFPERGVLFSFSAEAPGQVGQLILDSIDAEPFLLRAQNARRETPSAALDDVAQALELEPGDPWAFELQARISLDVGLSADALHAAQRAAQSEPENIGYQLTHAEALAASGEFANALAVAQQAAADAADSPLEYARAQLICGNCLAAGPERDYQQALDHHLEAIQSAERLRTHAHEPTRRQALELLLETHLAVAGDVAWGRWKSKPQVVPQWLARAESIAERLDEAPGDRRAHWQVLCAAMAADAGTQGRASAATLIEELEVLGKELIAAAADPLRAAALRWKLGLALYDAMQAEQYRERPDAAFAIGERAATTLEAAIASRQPAPAEHYLLGRLYFRLGSILAISKEDHAGALAWFDRATPLLELPLPPGAPADQVRLGETFVSMGVSYWDQQRQEEALRLTEQGAAILERTVREDSTQASVLSVPYGNLSSMHRHLGHDDTAQDFDRLAQQSETSKTR